MTVREATLRTLSFSRFVRVLGLVVPLALLLALPALAAAAEQRLIAMDGDDVGRSVAIDGNIAVVGAPESDGDKGAVFVFNRTGDVWVRTGKLTASDGAAGHNLGASVAIDGDVIVAGAPNANAAYTFATLGAATRTQTAKLTAGDTDAGDILGTAVAIEGDTIVVGNAGDDLFTFDEGSAYTFTRTGGNRTDTAKLTASDFGTFDGLGQSLALQGDTIVAGAPGDDTAIADEGSLYTFTRTGGDRNQTAKLTASDAAIGDRLATSVAIEGPTIVAGAPEDGAIGSLYTFARTGAAARNQTAKLTSSDGASGDDLGESVAIRAPFIVAGAPGDDGDRGSLYSFATTGAAARNQVAKLVPADGQPGDQLGRSISTDAGNVVAGAPLDAVGAPAPNQGSALVVFGSNPLFPGGAGLRPGACANIRVGTAGPDVLAGTTGGDRILGLGGNDQIGGLGGDDCLVGGSGADLLVGALGADRLQGDSGNDVAGGGPGRDRLTGGSGNDRLTGEASNDRLSGASGADRLSGGSGGDRLGGGSGRDRMSGGSSGDRLSGNSGGDRLTGGGGRDRLAGNAGNDRLSGGSGADRLTAGRGRNRLSGGSGNDRLNAINRRRDVVRCGAGNDRVRADRIDLLIGCELVRLVR